MNFHQSPITKYVVTGGLTGSVDSNNTGNAFYDYMMQPYPLDMVGHGGTINFPNGYTSDTNAGSSYPGWRMGRVVNVFFDTPFWPTAALQITVKAVSSGASPAIVPGKNLILLAPNAVITDYAADALFSGTRPYYTFLRGNPVYPNGYLYNSNKQNFVNDDPSLPGPVPNASYWANYAAPFSPSAVDTTFPGVSDSGIAMGAVSTGELRICYSGVLQDIKPSGSRLGLSSSAWVKPTDTIELLPVGVSSVYLDSNLAFYNRIASYDSSGNKYPIITAVRQKANNGDWAIEFSALVNNSQGSGQYADGRYPNWQALLGSGDNLNPVNSASDGTNSFAYKANEIYFTVGPANATYQFPVKGLAIDQVICNVVGRDVAGNIVFTGRLGGAANLTYFKNNSTSITNSYFDPTKYNIMLLSDFAKNGRPTQKCNTAVLTANSDQVWEYTVGKDASGIQPLKSLAIYDTSTTAADITVLAITVTPLQ